jgi:hypothetical protein
LDWDLGDWAERVRGALSGLEEADAWARELEEARLEEHRVVAVAGEVVRKWFRGPWNPGTGISVSRDELPELESAVQKWRQARERSEKAREALKMAEAGAPMPGSGPLLRTTVSLAFGSLLGWGLALSFPPWQAALFALSFAALVAGALGVWLQSEGKAATEAARRDLAASAAESDVHRARVFSMFGNLQLDTKAPPTAGFVGDVTRLVELHEALDTIEGHTGELRSRVARAVDNAVGLAEELGYRRCNTALTAGLPLAGRLGAYESLSQISVRAGQDLLQLARRMEIRAEKHLDTLEKLREQVRAGEESVQGGDSGVFPALDADSVEVLETPLKDFLLHGGDLAARLVQELRRLASDNQEALSSWLPPLYIEALELWLSHRT